MQNVYSGTKSVVVTEGFVRSRQLYFGVSGDQEFLDEITCNSTGQRIHYFELASMQTLVDQARALLMKGITIASTMFSQPSKTVLVDNKHTARTTGGISFDLDKINGHVENLYLQNVANITTMGVNEVQIIGDRNWCDQNGEQFYLAIVRENIDQFALVLAQVNRTTNPPTLRIADKNSGDYGKIGQLSIYDQNA